MSADVVHAVKQRLVSRGEDVTGVAGAFKIASHAARELNAGVLYRPSRNNYQGYAPDIVMFPNGDIYDCLIDAGGRNEPAWQYKGNLAGDPESRYVAATELFAPPAAEPPSPPTRPPAGDEPALARMAAEMARNNQALAALTEEIRKLRESVEALRGGR
jgi:hypothetical protein